MPPISPAVRQLLAEYPIISDQISRQELEVILSCLEQTLRGAIPGDIVEFGCYTGTTSLFLQRLLQQHTSDTSLHVYDSFAGLPEKTLHDQSVAGDQFITGQLHAKKSDFILNFKKAHLPLPVIHKGWFRELTDSDIPERIAFAFLDGDFYDSITDSLKLVWPRLSPGAILIVDDYHNEALPGTQKALDSFLGKMNKGEELKMIQSLAILRLSN